MAKRLQPNIESPASRRLAFALKWVRRSQGLSRRALADRLVYDEDTIQNYENLGYRRHSLWRAERIARALGKRLVVTLEQRSAHNEDGQ